MADASPERLRPRPSERFAAPEDVFDLSQASEYLRREPSGQHGHKQIALFRHGAATLALYLFDRGGRLPDHVVDGPVVIHVLSGRVNIETTDGRFEVGPGQLFRLTPGVAHDLEAAEPTELLMIICIEGPGSHG